MNLTLKRDFYRPDGIFSTCTGDNGIKIMSTLEHAYGNDSAGWFPKLPPGVYTCVRGEHRLDGMPEDFETFEITGVPGHTGILFHWGNFNRNSNGCVLTGEELFTGDDEWMVTASRKTFAELMRLQNHMRDFQLRVVA